MINDNINKYYSERANEYELIYHKPERQNDLIKLRATVGTAFKDKDVLEIACGTGYWTEVIATSASSITAMDYSAEVIEIAGHKNYNNCNVEFIQDDAFVLSRINKIFDACFQGFWISHVYKNRLEPFFKNLHNKLAAGAYVMIMDNKYVEGSSTPISRKDNEGNTYQQRKLKDGTTYEILKNFPAEEELYSYLKNLSTEFRFTETEYYWVAEYRTK